MCDGWPSARATPQRPPRLERHDSYVRRLENYGRCGGARDKQKQPPRVCTRGGQYHHNAEVIQVITVKVSKNLEIPVVPPPDARNLHTAGLGEKEVLTVFYSEFTKATHTLVSTVNNAG